MDSRHGLRAVVGGWRWLWSSWVVLVELEEEVEIEL